MASDPTADQITLNGTNFTVGDTLEITFPSILNTPTGTLYIGNDTVSYNSATDGNPFEYVLVQSGTYYVYYINESYSVSTYHTISVEESSALTLNESLEILGELMAANLTTKGVTASANDGLTTLANKVLQITGGGSSTIIYQPTLDGTESITTIATYTPTITNNTLTNGCGYLTNGWDNTIDWELTFDYYATGDNNGYLVIPKGTTQRDYKGLQQWYCNQLNFYVNGTKPTGYITNATSCNEWISVKITKIGYVWTVYYNDVQKTQWDTESYASIVDSWTEMCIGLDKNVSSRYATIKNIVVKAIGGGSDCSQYQTQINNAITYINGDGS